MQKFKPYKKEFGHSYTFGIFPTLELLIHRPSAAEHIIVSSKLKPSIGLDKLRELCAAHNIQIQQMDHALLMRITRNENCYALGGFKKFHTPLAADHPHIVLVNPDDMGNLGTIIRTMIGFDFQDLAIITPAADVFDPKVIRASMGALFQLNVAQFKSFGDYNATFDQHHLYPFVVDGATKLAKTTFDAPYSLIFGNEGAGLPATFATVGTGVSIEQTNNIDSLNVATAMGIALHHIYLTSLAK